MKKVTVIICAYNEANTIKDVILSISDAIIVSEIIVVNDGSTDNTKQIIEELKTKVDITDIHLKHNHGKGYAMAIGVENAVFDIVLFIDADLSNINSKHITQLVNPLLTEEADMVLGQATETLINYNINPFKSLSGQRALNKNEIVPIFDKIQNSKFGVETLINLYYRAEGKTIKYIMLEGLKHPTKFEKTSTPKAIKEFVKEGHQIAQTTFNNFDLITSSIKKKLKI